jgi:hypothetical protein
MPPLKKFQQTPLEIQVDASTKKTQTITTTPDQKIQQLSFDTESIIGKPLTADSLGYFDVDPGITGDYDFRGAFEGAPHGWIQTILGELQKKASSSIENIPRIDDSYQNNFMINYHSYVSPLPIPLQGFVTDAQIVKQVDAPYESFTLSMTCSFDFASALFAGEDGHPSPGGWILVRQKNIPTDNSEQISEMTNFDLDPRFHENLNSAPALFFGTVSEINWVVGSDETGNFTCEITLTANSFIHNLIHGEFRTSAIVGKDQTKSNLTPSDYVIANDPNTNQPVIVKKDTSETLETIQGSETSRFMLNSKDYLDFIIQMIMNSSGQFKDDDGVYRTNESNTKLPNSYILKNMLQYMAYPVLPLSLYAEPMDIETFYDNLIESAEQGLVSFQNRLSTIRGQGFTLPDNLIEPFMEGLTYILEGAVAENTSYYSELTGRTNVGGVTLPSGDDVGLRTSYDSTYSDGKTPLFDSVRARDVNGGKFAMMNVSLSLQEFLDSFKQTLRIDNETYYKNLTLGEMIHVASTRADVPTSSSLYPAMPKYEILDQDIKHIKNLQVKGQTVWGLLRATFQTDPELIEFYPTMIPLTGYYSRESQFSKDYEIIQGHKPNPLWNLIGGIPTIVYRYKPLHPQLKGEISKEKIDSLNKFHNTLNRNTYVKSQMQYKTIYETNKSLFTITNQEGKSESIYIDNSYYEKDESGSFPDADSSNSTETNAYLDELSSASRSVGGSFNIPSRGYYRPTLIRKEQIVSMQFNQDDTLRVNGTHTSDPAVESASGLIKYAITPSLVLNTDSAMRHGLRMYENVYPFFDLQNYNADSFEKVVQDVVELVKSGKTITEAISESSAKGKLNSYPNYAIKAGACSERSYMLYGDEQKYFRGTIVCKALSEKVIFPGTWIEVAISPYKEKRNAMDKSERFMLVYCIGVNQGYAVDNETGMIINTTNIIFERGSIGAVIPNFPTRKSFDLEGSRQSLINRVISDEEVVRQSSVSRSPMHKELEPIVMKESETIDEDVVYVITDTKHINNAYRLGMITKEQRDEYLSLDIDGNMFGWPFQSMEEYNKAFIETLPQDKQDRIKPELRGE